MYQSIDSIQTLIIYFLFYPNNQTNIFSMDSKENWDIKFWEKEIFVKSAKPLKYLILQRDTNYHNLMLSFLRDKVSWI